MVFSCCCCSCSCSRQLHFQFWNQVVYFKWLLTTQTNRQKAKKYPKIWGRLCTGLQVYSSCCCSCSCSRQWHFQFWKQEVYFKWLLTIQKSRQETITLYIDLRKTTYRLTGFQHLFTWARQPRVNVIKQYSGKLPW